MITVFDARKVVPFSLPDDTGDVRTIFDLGFFNRAMYHHLVNKHLADIGTMDDQQKKTASRGFVEDLVRYGVRGWQDLDGAAWDDTMLTSEDIAGVGTVGCLTDRALDILPPRVMIALGNRLNELNFLTGDRAKN
jgi:hypothetical protein